MAIAVNDSALGVAVREAVGLASRPRFWAVFAGVVVLLGLGGPFGTYDALPLAGRLVYWSVLGVLTFWLGVVTSMTVASLAEDRGARPMHAAGLGGLAASLPVSILVGLVNAVTFGTSVPAGMLELLPSVAAISTVVAVIYEVLEARQPGPVSDGAEEARPAWLNRLPDEIGRDLILLHSQDHYVLAQTPMGRSLIRMSLTDATAELGGYGLRVHRSWWVARRWITRLEHRDGTQVITLRDGQQVPIGRAYRKAVRAALRGQ